MNAIESVKMNRGKIINQEKGIVLIDSNLGYSLKIIYCFIFVHIKKDLHEAKAISCAIRIK